MVPPGGATAEAVGAIDLAVGAVRLGLDRPEHSTTVSFGDGVTMRQDALDGGEADEQQADEEGEGGSL